MKDENKPLPVGEHATELLEAAERSKNSLGMVLVSVVELRVVLDGLKRKIAHQDNTIAQLRASNRKAKEGGHALLKCMEIAANVMEGGSRFSLEDIADRLFRFYMEHDGGTDQTAKAKVLGLIENYGGIDGAHHKQWVIDQVVRVLTGDRYDEWVRGIKDGVDGPDTYHWDEGIAP